MPRQPLFNPVNDPFEDPGIEQIRGWNPFREPDPDDPPPQRDPDLERLEGQLQRIKAAQRRQEDEEIPVGEEVALPKQEKTGFCPNYENLEDIRMRLDRTIVMLGGEPTLITRIQPFRQDFRIYTMQKEDEQEKFFYFKKEQKNLDLRGPPPGYVVMDGRTYHMRRSPHRQQRQGLNRENTILDRVQTHTHERVPETWCILTAVRARKNRQWSPAIQEVVEDGIVLELPMSRDIALYRYMGNVALEYKGRFLGNVERNRVYLNPEDMDKSWIRQAVQAVNMEPIHA